MCLYFKLKISYSYNCVCFSVPIIYSDNKRETTCQRPSNFEVFFAADSSKSKLTPAKIERLWFLKCSCNYKVFQLGREHFLNFKTVSTTPKTKTINFIISVKNTSLIIFSLSGHFIKFHRKYERNSCYKNDFPRSSNCFKSLESGTGKNYVRANA